MMYTILPKISVQKRYPRESQVLFILIIKETKNIGVFFYLWQAAKSLFYYLSVGKHFI